MLRLVAQHDIGAPPVAGVGLAAEQAGVVHRPDPAQCRGRRNGGRDAQARDRHAAPLDPRGEQVQQHVPGGIGEQVGREILGAQPARADDRADLGGGDVRHGLVRPAIFHVGRPDAGPPLDLVLLREIAPGQARQDIGNARDFIVEPAQAHDFGIARDVRPGKPR